jgi:hypothetical protein
MYLSTEACVGSGGNFPALLQQRMVNSDSSGKGKRGQGNVRRDTARSVCAHFKGSTRIRIKFCYCNGWLVGQCLSGDWRLRRGQTRNFLYSTTGTGLMSHAMIGSHFCGQDTSDSEPQPTRIFAQSTSTAGLLLSPYCGSNVHAASRTTILPYKFCKEKSPFTVIFLMGNWNVYFFFIIIMKCLFLFF